MSTKSPTSPSISEKFQPGKLFWLVQNGQMRQNRDPPRYRFTGSVEKLLADATEILKLNGRAKHIYTTDGVLVKDPSTLPTKSVLVISCGEQFIQKSSPAELKERLKKVIQDASKHEEPVKAESPKRQKPADGMSMRSEMTAITISQQPRSRYARYHQLLAVLPGSVEDHIRDSMLATYVTMDPQVRETLLDRDVYENMLRTTQTHLFIEQLVSQGICTPLSESPVDKELQEWSLKLLDEATVDEIRFEVSGPRYSGKTMAVGCLAELFYRKLLGCEECDDWLMFPLNLALYTLYMDDPVEFYNVIINVLFQSLRFARFELLPFFLGLKEWFLSAPTIGAMTKLPQALWDLQRIDANGLVALGKECHNAFHRATEVDAFFTLVFSLPVKFADVMKMKGAVYILDHCDCASPDVAKAICTTLRKMPFIIGGQNDKDFAKAFRIKGAHQVFTEGALSEFTYNKSLSIPDRGLKITIDAMMGCPGFIASFVSLCELFEKNAEKLVIGNREAVITSKIDKARKTHADQELGKLCLALANAGSKTATYDVVNGVLENRFSVKVISKS